MEQQLHRVDENAPEYNHKYKRSALGTSSMCIPAWILGSRDQQATVKYQLHILKLVHMHSKLWKKSD